MECVSGGDIVRALLIWAGQFNDRIYNLFFNLFHNLLIMISTTKLFNVYIKY